MSHNGVFGILCSRYSLCKVRCFSLFKVLHDIYTGNGAMQEDVRVRERKNSPRRSWLLIGGYRPFVR